MKQRLKKWTVRLAATAALMAGLLLIIVLNPGLTYAGKTTYKNFTVYHNQPVDPALTARLDEAMVLLQQSELYSSVAKFDICLDDGSVYPKLIRAVGGRAFARGFYNKAVLQCTISSSENHAVLNGYKWNLAQLLAHELTHCLQFSKYGFCKSNPAAGIPAWKWEGYAEYVARKDNAQSGLAASIDRYLNTGSSSWAVTLADGTICPGEYYKAWLLVQYCTDIKQMTYGQLLADTAAEESITAEMMSWHKSQQLR